MSDDNTNPRGADHRYRQVVRTLRETPWAILPSTLASIIEIVEVRVAGDELSEEEIQARIGAGPAQRDSFRQGAVAVIPVYGVIVPKANLFSQFSGGTSVQGLQAALRDALADSQVSSIVLDIDSPGGSTDLIPELAGEIRAARGKKPIVAVANTLAASAAYWLGAQADEFVVTPSGEVGSIGVFAAHDDVSALQEKMGVKTTLISAGKFKTETSPFAPLSDEAKAAIQERVDEFYGMFVRDVARGRGVSVETVRSDFGEGRVVGARQALESGMVDAVDTLEATVIRSARRAAQKSAASAGVAEGDAFVAAFAAALAPHSTAVVDESWDGPAEEAAMSNDAGEATYRRMYAWIDPAADADTKTAYKFPHHKVTDGTPGPANVRGVRQGLSRIPQADIPDEDRAGVERHLRKHLDDFNSTNGLSDEPHRGQSFAEQAEIAHRAVTQLEAGARTLRVLTAAKREQIEQVLAACEDLKEVLANAEAEPLANVAVIDSDLAERAALLRL